MRCSRSVGASKLTGGIFAECNGIVNNKASDALASLVISPGLVAANESCRRLVFDHRGHRAARGFLNDVADHDILVEQDAPLNNLI